MANTNLYQGLSRDFLTQLRGSFAFQNNKKDFFKNDIEWCHGEAITEEFYRRLGAHVPIASLMLSYRRGIPALIERFQKIATEMEVTLYLCNTMSAYPAFFYSANPRASGRIQDGQAVLQIFSYKKETGQIVSLTENRYPVLIPTDLPVEIK